MYLVLAITENTPNQILGIGSKDKDPQDVLFPETHTNYSLFIEQMIVQQPPYSRLCSSSGLVSLSSWQLGSRNTKEVNI